VKVPYSWLREMVDVAASPQEVAVAMGVRGFAVEGLEPLPGGDTALDFEVTANRPDCTSVRGLAREVATAYDLPLRDIASLDALTPGTREPFTVDIERPDLCGRYVGAFAAVSVAPSPEWLQARLRACGVRPINNVVDVTNYVLLELGQPMHAFDMTKLVGPSIRVRAAVSGEQLRTLDGQDRALTPEMLVIADASAAVAIAGVMGGADSEVSSSTRSVVLESASFNPRSVRRTSKALGLKTEASSRFERGVDPALPAVAMARACALLRQLGANPAGTAIDCHPVPVAGRSLHLRRARLAGLLGFPVPDGEVLRILRALGFTADAAADGWDVAVPTSRVDVAREVDLIEEVARHHGYDRVPAHFPTLVTPPPPSDPRGPQARLLRGVMAGAGFFEAMTFGFIAEASAAPFAAAGDIVGIANPLSETFAVLRPSIVPGLLDGIGHNRRREQPDVRLFEIGNRFTRAQGERRALAFAWAGTADPPHWSAPPVPVSFFDAKGVVERVCLALGVSASVEPDAADWLVRGQSAALVAEGRKVGIVGRLAPAVAEHHGIPREDVVFAGELDLDAWSAQRAAPVRVAPLPRFPSVSRDIALLVDDTLPAATLRDTIRAAAPATLVQVREFDRYQGKGIPDGKVSLAMRLTFRSPDRTLTDGEVQSAMDQVLAAVRAAHGAVQR
jgi:phenylalanyl-tRNA synthetase beta chain